MKTKITYGLILASVGIVLRLISFLLGYETDKAGSITFVSIMLGVMSFAAWCVLIWLGIRAVRDERPDQCLTYGQGLGAGVIIALVAAVVGAVYVLIHITVINPNFVENALEMTRQKMAERGLPEEQMEMALKITRFTMHPAILAVGGFIGSMVLGTVVSLIAAAIVKRAPQPQPAAQVPPPL